MFIGGLAMALSDPKRSLRAGSQEQFGASLAARSRTGISRYSFGTGFEMDRSNRSSRKSMKRCVLAGNSRVSVTGNVHRGGGGTRPGLRCPHPAGCLSAALLLAAAPVGGLKPAAECRYMERFCPLRPQSPRIRFWTVQPCSRRPSFRAWASPAARYCPPNTSPKKANSRERPHPVRKRRPSPEMSDILRRAG